MYMTGMYIQQVYLHINYSMILYSCNAFLVVVSYVVETTRENTGNPCSYILKQNWRTKLFCRCVQVRSVRFQDQIIQLHMTKKRSEVWIRLIQQNKWRYSKFAVRKGGSPFIICILFSIEAVSVYFEVFWQDTSQAVQTLRV